MSELSADELQNYKVDKSQFGPGPWQDEPDRVQFTHAGYSCLIIRQAHFGHLCGYTGVPEDHPDFGKHYNDVDVSVHGGLTYSGECADHICHVPEPGYPETVWWLGFDAGHAWDVMPGLDLGTGVGYSSYKDMAYMRTETESLAEQLAARAGHSGPVRLGPA